MIENYEEVLFNAQLSTKRLLLRKFKLSDACAVLAYGSDPLVLEHLEWEGVKTTKEAQKSITDFYMKTAGCFAIEPGGLLRRSHRTSPRLRER